MNTIFLVCDRLAIGWLFGVLIVAAVVWGYCPLARADSLAVSSTTSTARDELVFVPRLAGGFTLGVRSGLNLPIGENQISQMLRGTAIDAMLGYRWYMDFRSERSLLVNFVFSVFDERFSFSPQSVGTVFRPGIEVEYVRKFMNYNYQYFLAGLYLEANAVIWTDAPNTLLESANEDNTLMGVRLSGGLELGLGSIFHLDPYLFFETPVLQVGLEYQHIQGVNMVSFCMSLIVRFDWARLADQRQ